MSVQCKTCDARIQTTAKMPLRIVADEHGEQFIDTDYSAVYEHVRDEHPDQWTDEMVAEFEHGLARPEL